MNRKKQLEWALTIIAIAFVINLLCTPREYAGTIGIIYVVALVALFVMRGRDGQK